MTGGAASVIGPLAQPAAEGVMTLGGSMTAEVLGTAALQAGTEGAGKLGDIGIETLVDKALLDLDSTATTESIKTIRITIKFKHTMRDASIGFFRASERIHTDTSLFTSFKDFLSDQKGWFSPYLFSTARRPVIPRKISPDVVFAHSPFLKGDYEVASKLLRESTHQINLCPSPSSLASGNTEPRRLVLMLLGITPYKLNSWTSCQRPGESIMNYLLLDGCPAVILPARPGTPLIAWDSITLKELYRLRGDLTKENGVVDCWCEFLSLCVDMNRVCHDGKGVSVVLRDAVEMCVQGAIKSAGSKAVEKEIDSSRAGLVIMRMP